MPSIISPTRIVLHDLVSTRLDDYFSFLEAAVYDDFDYGQITTSYNAVLKKRFAVIAFMTSRLDPVGIFEIVEKCQKRILNMEWSGWSKKATEQSQSGLGSLLAITGSQHHHHHHHGKVPVAHCLFVCHLMDLLSYCKVRQEGDKLTAYCLEHYFTLLQYHEFLQLMCSELAGCEKEEDIGLLAGLAKAIHRVSPDTFSMAISEVVRQPLLKPLKHEYLIRSLEQLDFELFPIDRLLVNLKLLETLVVSFSVAHGYRLKESYICFFSLLFAKLAGKVEAEANLMEWKDVVERLLYKKLVEYLLKPRYNASAARLLACLVLVSSEDFFREHWYGAADLIISRIRDKYLDPMEFKIVVQLVHVYFNRYPEAWATMSGRLEGLNKSVIGLLPTLLSHSDHNQVVLYVTVCGCKLTRLTFNDLLMPFLDCSSWSPQADLVLMSRALVAVKSYNLIVKRLQRRLDRPRYPDRFSTVNIPQRLEPITDDFYTEHLQLDQSMSMRYSVSLGHLVMWLDEQVLWSDAYYSNGVDEEGMLSIAEETILEIFEAVPEVSPCTSDPRLFTMLMCRYLFYGKAQICESVFDALSRIIQGYLDDPKEEVARKWESMFWSLISNLEAPSERCTRGLYKTISLLCKLLSNSKGPWRHLPEDDRAAIVNEVILKAAMQSASGRLVDDWLEGCSELAHSLSTNSTKNADILEKFVDLKRAKNLLNISNSSLISTLKMIIGKRLIEITGQLMSGRSLQGDSTEILLSSYSTYISFFLHFGPISPERPDQSAETKKKSRRVSIAFSTDSVSSTNAQCPRHIFRSIQSCCQHILPLLLNDSSLVRLFVVKSFVKCHPQHLEDVLLSLQPYEKIISNDLRNIKYRFTRRNKKSDQLKVDLSLLLGQLMLHVLPKRRDLFTAQTANKSIQFLLKCLLEVFYFCSEIDIDNVLPSLRSNLAMMIAGWAEAVLKGAHDRFHFIPFKLHSEMWLTLCRWYADGEGLVINHERQKSLSSLNSLTVPSKSDTTSVQNAMVALSTHLMSPPPGHRQDSVSLHQFFTWTDSLIANGHHEVAMDASRRLVFSNLALSDRLLEKAFCKNHPVYDTIVYESPNITTEQKEILKLYKQKIQCNLP